MKRKLFGFLSLAVLASMLLAACAPAATPTAAPEPTQAPAAEQPTQAPAVEEPTQASAEPTAAPEPTEAPKSDRKGGWLDKIVFSGIAEVEPAIAQLQAGTIDAYAVSSENAVAYDKVKADSNLAYSNSYGSSNQMVLNTAECKDGSFNPFTNMKIREAMNWAVDRNYVAQEIMAGMANPKYTAISTVFADYSRYADVMSALETKYAYNIDKAKEVVKTEMEAAGAKLNADGKWEMNGKLVTIIGLIRTEDKRKEIGNYFSNQLETLGFTVDRQEKVRSDASPIWAEGDPKDCKFGFYTAGWIAVSISRDEGNMFVQYNTNKMQGIPAFALYQPSAKLTEVEDKLFTNNFASMDERASLFKDALELSMQESWWGVWMTDNIGFSPTLKNVKTAYDLAGGIASAQMFPYTMRFDGKEGGELKVAQSDEMVEPWAPIGGSNWTDDAMPQRATMDWGLIYDPYTGLPVPKLVQKADVVVQEGLPVSKSTDWVNLSFEKEIKVPADAWADWDPVAQKFITVGEKYPDGVTAKTKTVVYYRPELWQTTWHDGSPLSVGDFVFGMIMNLDPGKEKSKIYDESLKSGEDTFMSHFKGVKIVSTDPLTIETYDDQFQLDAEMTVTDWYPNRYNPAASTLGNFAWHALSPALMAEEDGKLALSADKAEAKKVERTSLLAGPAVELEAEYMDKAAAENYLPYAPTMSQFVKPEEITLRWENLKKWYEAKKHFWLGTGPYFIDQVYPVEKNITVSHYDNYIFPADEFASYEEPLMAVAAVDGPTTVAAGEEAAFDVTVTNNDQPYPADKVSKVAYLLFNSNNELVSTGEAKANGDGTYQAVVPADVTGKLEAGSSKITIVVTTSSVSIPATASLEFVVTK